MPYESLRERVEGQRQAMEELRRVAEDARAAAEAARKDAQASREDAAFLREQLAEQVRIVKDIQARFEALVRDYERRQSGKPRRSCRRPRR